MQFYETYVHLCKEHNKSPSKVAGEIGISRGTVSRWKLDGYTPRADILQKISEYFSIPVSELLSGRKKEPLESDSLSNDKQTLIKIVENMSDEEVKSLLMLLRSRLQ